MTKHATLIKKLSGVSEIAQTSDNIGLRLTQTNHNCWLDLGSASIERFSKQLSEDLVQTKTSVKNLENRLKNKAYVDNAPEKLVTETKNQLAETKQILDKQIAEYERFK